MVSRQASDIYVAVLKKYGTLVGIPCHRPECSEVIEDEGTNLCRRHSEELKSMENRTGISDRTVKKP